MFRGIDILLEKKNQICRIIRFDFFYILYLRYYVLHFIRFWLLFKRTHAGKNLGGQENFNANFAYFRNVLYLDIQNMSLLEYNLYLFPFVHMRVGIPWAYSSVISTNWTHAWKQPPDRGQDTAPRQTSYSFLLSNLAIRVTISWL